MFTHGHGLTLGPVNQVTSEGLPVLFVRDLPPVTTVDLQITEPSIYFGELANDYVIVRTRAQEFHYPKGEDNVYTQYAGNGGVPLGSFWRKLLFAAHFRNYQILLSDDITTESRLMFDRQIRRRVAKIAPFLVLDDDPYPVVSDGRIFWIQDAYTVSDRYPYSTSSARRELHPQLGQGRHRRLSGLGDVLRRGADRSDRADAREDLSEPDAAARRDARGPAAARALSRRHLRRFRRRSTRRIT